MSIIDNDTKMKYMKDHFGMDYYILFGELLQDGRTIQQAINECWSHFMTMAKHDSL